jgi:subtilisin family serine protease
VKLFESLASLLQAQSLLANQPTLLVAAAGNESNRSGVPSFEIAVSPPAVATGIVSVAALQEGTGGLGVADFSNTGAQVSGPGVAVISAKRGGGLEAMSGTSMATPHVVGVAALWAEKLRRSQQLNASTLINTLVGSATQAPLLQPFDPSDVGLGIVQAPQTL